MKPEVSVIIPTYNRSQVLPRAVDSVLAQSFENLELLIVDDGSRDGTSEVLDSYKDHPRVRIFQTENRGVSAARNLGIRKSEGDWVAFLDSDDEWLPEKLSLQLLEAGNKPQCPLVHGDEIWIRKGVRVNPMKKHKKGGGDVFASAVQLCCISPSTVLIRKKIFSEVGFFREDFPVCEDYDLWLKLLARYPVAFVDQFLIKKYGGHQDQLSRKYKAMDYWRVRSLSDLIENQLDPEKYRLASDELKKKAQILLRGYRKHENLENFDEVFKILI